MRVLVCGGRNFRSPAQVWRSLDELHAKHKFTALMQGGASGVDMFAKEWATTQPNIDRFVCKAEWSKHGPAAGPIRNARMLEWKPDMVIAFAGGAGTADMVKRACAGGIDVLEVR